MEPRVDGAGHRRAASATRSWPPPSTKPVSACGIAARNRSDATTFASLAADGSLARSKRTATPDPATAGRVELTRSMPSAVIAHARASGLATGVHRPPARPKPAHALLLGRLERVLAVHRQLGGRRLEAGDEAGHLVVGADAGRDLVGIVDVAGRRPVPAGVL